MFCDINEKNKKILEARIKFIEEYCKLKNWSDNYDDLSLDQALEIRNQPKWKHPNDC